MPFLQLNHRIIILCAQRLANVPSLEWTVDKRLNHLFYLHRISSFKNFLADQRCTFWLKARNKLWRYPIEGITNHLIPQFQRLKNIAVQPYNAKLPWMHHLWMMKISPTITVSRLLRLVGQRWRHWGVKRHENLWRWLNLVLSLLGRTCMKAEHREQFNFKKTPHLYCIVVHGSPQTTHPGFSWINQRFVRPIFH